MLFPTITGDTGRLTWGYQVASVTGRFEIALKNGVYLLRARVGEADPFRLRQQGLVFEVTVHNVAGKSQVWKWPVLTLDVKDGVIEATLKVDTAMQKKKG